MTNADITADAPAAPRAARTPRRLWPWVLGGTLLFTLLAAGSVAALLLTLFDGLRDHAHVVINGQPWNWGGDWNGIWSDSDFGGGWGSGLCRGRNQRAASRHQRSACISGRIINKPPMTPPTI